METPLEVNTPDANTGLFLFLYNFTAKQFSMCYDVSARWRHEKSDNEKRMKEIEKAKPGDFFMDKEWIALREQNRVADFHIRDYDRKIAMGVKF